MGTLLPYQQGFRVWLMHHMSSPHCRVFLRAPRAVLDCLKFLHSLGGQGRPVSKNTFLWKSDAVSFLIAASTSDEVSDLTGFPNAFGRQSEFSELLVASQLLST